jgi:hypothetical protein
MLCLNVEGAVLSVVPLQPLVDLLGRPAVGKHEAIAQGLLGAWMHRGRGQPVRKRHLAGGPNIPLPDLAPLHARHIVNLALPLNAEYPRRMVHRKEPAGVPANTNREPPASKQPYLPQPG